MKKAKKKKPTPSPRCPRCLQRNNVFIDLSADQDAQLQMLSTLLSRCREDDPLEAETMAEIGYAIEAYLQRKLVRESVFVGRTLRRCTLRETDLQAELARVKAYLKDAEAE